MLGLGESLKSFQRNIVGYPGFVRFAACMCEVRCFLRLPGGTGSEMTGRDVRSKEAVEIWV